MQGKQPLDTVGNDGVGTHGHTPPIDRELKVELLGSLNAAHRALTAGRPKWGPELTQVLDAIDAAVAAVYQAAAPRQPVIEVGDDHPLAGIFNSPERR